MRKLLTCTALFVCFLPVVSAQEFDESFDHWPVDFRLNGLVIVANQLDNSDEVNAFFLRASGGEKAKIVAIAFGDRSVAEQEALRQKFEPAASLTLSLIDDPSQPLPADVITGLKSATGVMLLSDTPLSDGERQAILAVRGELQTVIARGGVVFASGPVAKMVSRIEIIGGERLAQVDDGLSLIPDSVIETDFSSDQDRLRVKSVLAAHPHCVAICLDANTAAVLDRRILRVLGSGRATVMVTANERDPFRVQTIQQSVGKRQSPNDFLIDLTQWRRVAMERTLDRFPPARPKTPRVENGTLVIVGGGSMPKDLMARFVEFAGGVEKAKLVYVPCSERDKLAPPQRTVRGWEKMGVRHATFIHTKDRHQANDDESFLSPLKKATGVWFGGGRQWNFSDSYYGTTAHKLMKDVLKRGGVIGGSSAGASIQARYLARATPISNFDIMAPGYERGGLGFISGVAIDQHFSQRGRQKDMTQLVDRYPQMLGIGLDEATAIVVQKSKANVVGRGKAHFYDRNLPVYPNMPDFIALPAGSSYDLAKRTVIEDTTVKDDKPAKELLE